MTTYVVNPSDPTTPANVQDALQGAEELRALKAKVNGIAIGAVGNQGMPRQTVLQGLLSTAFPALLAVSGTILGVDLKATTTPAILSFAQGFGNTGSQDAVESLFADSVNYWAALPIWNTSYLGLTRASAGVLTPFQTLAPPQYGDNFDQGKQSVLQFSGATGTFSFIDDFGNTWARGGAAKIQNNYFKFGTGALGGGGAGNALDGATDRITSTSFTSLGALGWTMRGWIKPLNALPGAGNSTVIWSAGNSTGFGALLGIFNNAGVIKFVYSLSSNGTSFDIAAAVAGTTTPVLGTEYFVELTYDALNGVYRIYVNGIQEASTTNLARVCAINGLSLGATFTGTNYYQGYIDKFELLPYCQHPGSIAYAVPTSAPNIATVGYASDWFDTSQMILKSPSLASTVAGIPPSFLPVTKLYVGEVAANATVLTGVTTYAYRGRYQSALTAVAAANVAILFSHNLGLPADQYDISTELVNLTGELGFTPSETVPYISSTGGYAYLGMITKLLRNLGVLQNAAGASPLVINRTTGAVSGINLLNWNSRFIAKRRF